MLNHRFVSHEKQQSIPSSIKVDTIIEEYIKRNFKKKKEFD